MANVNRKYMGAFLPTDIHYALIAYASRIGKDPVEAAGDLIQSALHRELEFMQGTLDEKDVRLELALEYLKVRQREQAHSQLVQIAQYILTSASTDEGLIDNLTRHCSSNGFDYKEVMETAQQMTRISSASVFSLGEDCAENQVGMFLAGLFKQSASIPVTEIERQAHIKGLNFQSLKLVKRKMGIISRRVGSCWHWEIASVEIPSSVTVSM